MDNQRKIICCECKKEEVKYFTPDWWFDEYKNMKERTSKLDQTICGECRTKISKTTISNGPAKCDRCWKKGEWGKGKWNENQGHIQCYELDAIFCYDCHDLLHYNK
jgi:hypothetical protein